MEFDPFPPAPGRCGNGVKNRVSLLLIMARKEGRLASRWIDRNPSRIFRKSQTTHRQLIIPSLGPLIKAKDGSNSPISYHYGRGAQTASEIGYP